MAGKTNYEIAKEILRLRISQLILNEYYKEKLFKIPMHLAFGHESIAVAVSEIMTGNDKLIAPHRNIHYNLAREKDKALKKIVNEFLIREDGLAQGKLGSMNLSNPKRNLIYSSSILGNNLPVATGVALGKKMNNDNSITIVVTGDGAMEEGTFYESLLFMCSHNLPVMIIIENNEWSLATKINERRSEININKFAESLGANYMRLTGNDVFNYIERLNEAKRDALKSKKPVCIEVELHTLGDWILKNAENPNGKYINYHWGVAPDLYLQEWPLIKEHSEDPLYSLMKHFDKEALEIMSKKVYEELDSEVERLKEEKVN